MGTKTRESHQGSQSYNDGERYGFVRGYTSCLNEVMMLAEAIQPGGAMIVADPAFVKLDRMFPDAEKIYPPLTALRRGDFDKGGL